MILRKIKHNLINLKNKPKLSKPSKIIKLASFPKKKIKKKYIDSFWKKYFM